MLIRRDGSDFYHQFRPLKLSEFICSEIFKNEIMGMFSGNKQSFLFHGMSGCGKSTLAKIIGLYLNCEKPTGVGEPCLLCNTCLEGLKDNPPHIIELNISKLNGVDDCRQITETMKFGTFIGTKKVYIFDECHRATKNAQDALLRSLEFPPKDCIIILCTTEKSKLLNTIVNRCHHLEFKYPSKELIYKLISDIYNVVKFNIDIEKTYNAILSSGLSGFREICVALEKVYDTNNLNSIQSLVSASPEIVEISKCILNVDWKGVTTILNGMIESSKKEGNKVDFLVVRLSVCNYLRGILFNAGLKANTKESAFSIKNNKIARCIKLLTGFIDDAIIQNQTIADLYSCCVIMGTNRPVGVPGLI